MGDDEEAAAATQMGGRSGYGGEEIRPTSQSLSSEHLLSQLMTSLAAGARAVQGLPLGDDFDYQSSFPEFRRLMEDSQGCLMEALVMTLEEAAAATPSFQPPFSISSYGDSTDPASDGGTSSLFHFENLDDPLLYETCTDLCDALLEQAERSSLHGNESLTEQLQAIKSHAQTSFARLLNGIVEMEKPQQVFSFGAGADSKINLRDRPFLPPYLQKKYHAKQELDMEALKRDGHGLETKFGEAKPTARVASNIVAPDHYYEHPYLPELRSLEYPDWELQAPQEQVSVTKDENLVDNTTWIDTPEALADLKSKLERPSVREVAIDLEAHSYRTFGGMICLIQMSFDDSDDTEKQKDYLIDPFPIWDLIHNALAPTLSNPNVVKVFHGADSDVVWLQRDFGLYVVNLFDTGRAARALRLPSYGFAHVLERYVDGARADKSHQLADWRQRPLPEAMKEYAIMDTHYLLDIYRALKYDLAKSKETTIEKVLDDSRKVCTIRYAPEPFRPDGYRSLTQRRGHKTELNSRQEEVLKALWEWRDQTSRKFDESHAYVCTNAQLMRLAMACPTNLSTLQSLMQPMPPLLIRNSKEVLSLIQDRLREQQRTKNNAGPPSSAFFKPAVSTRSEDVEDGGENRPSPRTLMSPVLGTEALYRQAGWISPANDHFSGDMNDLEVEEIVTTSATEDDADDEKDDGDIRRSGTKQSKGKKSARKPRRGVAVHEANQNYQTQQFTSHSLQLGGGVAEKAGDHGGIIDGFGPVRAVHSSPEELEEAVDVAMTNAAQIRTTQESRGIIGLMSSAELASEEVDDNGDGDSDQEDEKEKSEQEEFVIPRSVREIYRISNRNRRNKKTTSPGPPEPKPEELDELAKAEEVLKARSSRGKNYIDAIPVVPCSPKRQRTKSLGAASLSSSDEAGGQESLGKSRDDDIALMQEVGWIDSKEEMDNLLKGRPHLEGDDDDSSDDGDGKHGETPKPFDYSNVGSIGAFALTPSANPFFAGAALAGGHLNQQFVKPDKKKPTGTSRGSNKPSRRQAERPEKREGRSQAYKKK
ncbi:3'-5' exonuclease [Nitzschia inconspicua]|uniref:3'-5' exonuclease n=1 Tax=Nitzschia inconspicua TaxID=303405 RepID=A0A9K3PXA0_9STRA|nr:3'-5' exonuclease [Nitzschia inconspicua]